MDIITELTGMLNIPILILGLLIGYVIKHVIDNETLENKWIPVINVIVGAIVGVILCITSGAAITAEAILLAVIGGGVSCVASCGVYDTFVAFVDKGSTETPEKEE